MASFLNIPLTKVRVVNVVSAASKGRRKRSGTGITVELEIGDEPVANINATLSDSIDFSALLEYASDIVNECQVGNISESLNITGACETVEVPSSDPAVASIVYHTPSPDHLNFHTEPVSKYEGVLLKTQPKIRAADLSNNVVTELGTAEFPWQLTVSLRSGTGHPNAQLNGTLTVNCSNGWFNFTDLAISHMGSGYILDFNVTFPVEAENFTLASDPFDVEGRPLKIHVYKTSGDIVKNARFSVTLDLQDPNTLDIISDIAWRDHTWTAEASMLGNSPYGSLGGVLTSSFDPTTGRALFPDLNMGGFGVFYVQFRVVSNPPDFNLTFNHKMTIKNPAHVGMTIEEEYEVKVKFNVDYKKILPTEDKENEFEQMILTEYANTWPNVQLSVGSIKEGSIVVTFVIAGSSSDVNTTAYSLCDTIQNQTSYSYNGYSLTLSPYMTINNQTYYGVTCGDMEEEDEEEGLAVYWIVIIVLLSALIVAAVAAVVVWRCSVKPKTQTRDWRTGILHNGEKSVEDYLFREDSADLANFIRSKPPITTTIGGGEKRPHSGFFLRISSPGPISVTDLLEDKKSTSSTFAQPPAYSERMRAIEPMHVATKGNERWPRTPSSSMYGGLESRAHSAVSDRESPLPPVGQSMYTSE